MLSCLNFSVIIRSGGILNADRLKEKTWQFSNSLNPSNTNLVFPTAGGP